MRSTLFVMFDIGTLTERVDPPSFSQSLYATGRLTDKNDIKRVINFLGKLRCSHRITNKGITTIDDAHEARSAHNDRCTDKEIHGQLRWRPAHKAYVTHRPKKGLQKAHIEFYIKNPLHAKPGEMQGVIIDGGERVSLTMVFCHPCEFI
ncbi:hypothetical protein GALL_536910 [mine drainage metagenome]|uniref:Uncharacterized protein n=1 Tax=mine drainage metagenome TaxID=410659 RepID=A0A1J5P0Y5_9ZZZZ